MATIELDVKAIHPSNGAKYSPNLHKWLTQRERKHRAWTSSVFRDRDGVLWIGMLDEGAFLIGCRLMQVLCNGAKAESMAYPLKQLGTLEEVPDFWTRYAADGRCAIDTGHQMYFVGDDTRWHVVGDERKCLWCEKAHQRRERYTRTTEHERWVMGHNARNEPTGKAQL